MEPWLVPRGPDPSRGVLVRPVSPDLSSVALARPSRGTLVFPGGS